MTGFATLRRSDSIGKRVLERLFAALCRYSLFAAELLELAEGFKAKAIAALVGKYSLERER